MKRALSAILCFCVLVCMFTFTVGASTVVNIFNLTVTAPVVGQKPSNTASLPATASTYVVSVRWEGEKRYIRNNILAGNDLYKRTDRYIPLPCVEMMSLK